MRVLNLFSHGFSLPSGFFLEKPLCRQVSSIIEHNIVAQNCPKSSPVSSSVKTVKSPEKQSGLVPSQQPQVWQTTPQLKAPRAGRLVMSCVESNLPFECDSSCRRSEKGGLAGQQYGTLQRSAHNYNISCALLHAVPFSVPFRRIAIAARFANRGAGRRNPWPTI